MFRVCSVSMSRRNPPQRTIDDRAFPVRVKVSLSAQADRFRLNQMIYWLQDNMPRGDFAHHNAGDDVAYYFRTLEDAQTFLGAFPEAKLADGTVSPGYTSPALPFGRK